MAGAVQQIIWQTAHALGILDSITDERQAPPALEGYTQRCR